MQETIRSEDLKYASCCAALAPYTPRYMPFLRALPGTNFLSSDSETSNGENFFIFKADERSVPGSTLIEYNAENEEIIQF